MDAADAGEREQRLRRGERDSRETEWGLGLGLGADYGAGERLSRRSPLIYARARGGGRPVAGRAASGPAAEERVFRAGPCAWCKAQARPAPPGRASPGPLVAEPGRAWAGPTGSGCLAIYNER